MGRAADRRGVPRAPGRRPSGVPRVPGTRLDARYAYFLNPERPETCRGLAATVRLSCVIPRCPAAITVTFDYLGARGQYGGLAGTATILVAMGAEVGGG